MTKVAFFYANGTAAADTSVPVVLDQWGQILVSLGLVPKPAPPTTPQYPIVKGLHGINKAWPNMLPQTDIFCDLLDPNIFEAKKVDYAAAPFPMDQSIGDCVNKVIGLITKLPSGQPYAIGGFSQGAAVMSEVYNEIRSGVLSSSASRFLGGVMFGNVRRELNHRGEVGGTWSGTLYSPESMTGGHGVFPMTGPWPRLQNCDPTKWIEFAAVGDVAASVGETLTEQSWSRASGIMGGLGRADWGSALLDTAGIVGAIMAMGEFTKPFEIVDAVGDTYHPSGGGHVAYPWLPPPGNPDGDLTSYQIAIKWLESKAADYVKGTVMLPSDPTSASTTGWVSKLYPPA